MQLTQTYVFGGPHDTPFGPNVDLPQKNEFVKEHLVIMYSLALSGVCILHFPINSLKNTQFVEDLGRRETQRHGCKKIVFTFK